MTATALSAEATRLLSYLTANCLGREAATTAAQIATATGISTRLQQELIIELWGAGIPVCTACGRNPGTFIARDASEVAPYLHQLRQRRNAEAVRVAQIERQYPMLRETRTIRPPSRSEPDGTVRQLSLLEGVA